MVSFFRGTNGYTDISAECLNEEIAVVMNMVCMPNARFETVTSSSRPTGQRSQPTHDCPSGQAANTRGQTQKPLLRP